MALFRTGRLKLALEEVLSVLMQAPAGGSPVAGALMEQRAPLSMLGTCQVRVVVGVCDDGVVIAGAY